MKYLVKLIISLQISHKGSPFRIAILDETETARIVLLDHIPHNDASSPVYLMESTFTPYKISLFIPDVQCSKCSLQLLYVMTDKTTNCGIDTCYYNPSDAACKGSTDPYKATCAGAPNSNVCLEENECFSNCKLIKCLNVLLYCFLINIFQFFQSDHSCTDVTITGTKPFSSFALDGQPLSWEYRNVTMQMYRSESAEWSKSGWLQGVSEEFTTDYATLKC